MAKKDLCEVCQEKIGTKRITLNNNKFIHGYNYSSVRINKDCAAYLEEHPKEISDFIMRLYETKKSLLNKIVSVFFYDQEKDPEIIDYKINVLTEESRRLKKLRKKIYDYWPDYPPDWAERRDEVISKAKNRCQECKTKDPIPGIHVHHIKFLGRGGSNKISNLLALCESCHEKKHGGRSFKYDQSYIKPLAYPERLKSINKAIKSNKDLTFSYFKVKQKKWMKRKIKPNELTKEIWIKGKTKFALDNLYLVGHCYLRNDKRTFRVDRIKGLKISK